MTARKKRKNKERGRIHKIETQKRQKGREEDLKSTSA
jgi:hypothetical protein